MLENKKPKVLIFIDWFSPGYKAGGPVRSMVNMIENLVSDFDFYVVTRNNEYGEKLPYSFLDFNKWISKNDINVYYSSQENQTIANWKKIINDISPNVIFVNGIYSPKFSLYPVIASRNSPQIKTIVSPRGMLAPSAIKIKSLKKRIYLFITKILGVYNAVEWHATNKIEAEQIISIYNIARSKIVIAPNLSRKLKVNFEKILKDKNTLLLCSFARIAPEKNTLFAIKSLENINKEFSIEFHIFGDIYDKEYWELCKKEILLLPKNIKIEHKGTVHPDSILDNMRKYHSMFLPSKGENFGHVILESFMAARPVIISDKTPWRNLQAKGVGWDISLDNIDDFQNVIMRLAEMEQEEFDVLCDNAFKYGKEISENVEVVNSYKQMFSLK